MPHKKDFFPLCIFFTCGIWKQPIKLWPFQTVKWARYKSLNSRRLPSKTRAPFPSLSTAACEKTNYNTGAPLGGKHDPTVRCQNAKGLIDSPALNCVFELISSRYKGGPAVIVYQRCPLDSLNSSFSAAALWEREPATVMHFQEAFENHYPIADRADPMPLIFPIAPAHTAHFDYWDKHMFTFCTCTPPPPSGLVEVHSRRISPKSAWGARRWENQNCSFSHNTAQSRTSVKSTHSCSYICHIKQSLGTNTESLRLT